MHLLANPFVSSLAAALVSSLWQGIVIACALSLCIMAAPRISAASRFTVWATGFIVAACLPFMPLLASLTPGTNHGAAAVGPAVGAIPPLIQLDLRWSAVLLGAWAVAALYRAVDVAIHSLRLRRLWKTANPIEISDRLAQLLTDLGRARVQICSTNSLMRPGVIGFFAPRVLIPEWLLTRLSVEELEQIVLHEAEHLRRRDDWTNLAQKLLLVAFPLSPAMWWMERKLCREREMACDEGVVRVTHAPRAYAACLASLAERRLQQRAQALSLGAWQRRSELAHRVHGILLRKQTLRPLATGVFVGALGCGLVAGSVELARCPQLVAFVPVSESKGTAAVAVPIESAIAANPIQGDAVFHDRRERAPGYRSIQMKAIIPDGRATAKVAANTQPRSGRSSSAAHRAEPSRSRDMAMTKQQPALMEGESRQWLVFTTVEQIGATRRIQQWTADFDPRESVSGDTVVDGSTFNDEWNDPLRNETITRLILRILPHNASTAQPNVNSVHNGWIVIQL